MTDHDPGAWDEAHNAPILSWHPESAPEQLPDHPVHLVVEPSEPGRLHGRMLYEPFDSGTLIVSLHGALNRGRFKVPRFEWRRTLNQVQCARLYLSDSTLEQSGSLEIGWYIGSAQQDLISEYAESVRAIARNGGYTRVMCVGSSAGGFGALALSRQIAGSAAVVFSPQTSIAGYLPSHKRALTAAAFKDRGSLNDIEAEFGERVNMRKLYKASADTNYVRFVQNTRDRFHFEAHYAPFALSLGVDPDTGGSTADGRISFHAERQEEGHAPPSRGRFLKHIDDAHQQFFGTNLTIIPAEALQGKDLGNR
ncbi:hypothetical protein ACU18_15630 [Arthrobacter sp. ZBG10]|uniref:hypothetical protein n=1 Tax=Micrococcaceae TaxID=1268 RepID=UPI000680BF25|nr:MULTISPECIES: hypothetical protein [Micrococcaceae]KNH15854.1 hypothetical protein ACU18_15630 [Arthrobacter sp. ZBG10]KQR03492.1 hypothetical protein ASF72_10165 [Arthrobacter sp. Leaf141]